MKNKFANRKVRKEWFRIVKKNNLNVRIGSLPLKYASMKLICIITNHNERKFKRDMKRSLEALEFYKGK